MELNIVLVGSQWTADFGLQADSLTTRAIMETLMEKPDKEDEFPEEITDTCMVCIDLIEGREWLAFLLGFRRDMQALFVVAGARVVSQGVRS